MLGLNLSKIRTAHEHFEQVYQSGALERTADYQVEAPVTLAFDIHKDKQQFQLVGQVRTTLGLPCSRCLEGFEWPVAASFDLRYQPRAEHAGEGDREIADDDLTTALYDDEQIDLGQLMQEQLYLSLPMKPLCSATCQGLCPVCGTNLNRGTCTCERHWEDPRLTALKNLRPMKKEF
jgi:uncharacterized protein